METIIYLAIFFIFVVLPVMLFRDRKVNDGPYRSYGSLVSIKSDQNDEK